MRVTLPHAGRGAARRLPVSVFSVSIAALALGFVLLGQGLAVHAKAVLAQVLLERAFERTLATGRPVKPWPWADTRPAARIEIPRLHKSQIVLEGDSGQAMAFGPGHLSASPAAGEPGTAVYAAHRDTHFAFLGEVRQGDEIRVRRADGALVRFRVTGAEVVRWNASRLAADAPGRRIALVTCWPLGGRLHGPWRYVVRAERIAPDA